mgnify:CR=1 FL=1
MSSANDTTITEIIELHPYEIELLRGIRNRWRYGEVTILVRNGLPYRLVRVQEFIDPSVMGGWREARLVDTA